MYQRAIYQSMLDEWLESYKRLDREYDRVWEKMERHEAEGKAMLVRKNAQRMHEIEAEMRGMVSALSTFGFTIVWQNNEPVGVESC